MFLVHQIVNVLINPVFDVLALIIGSILLGRKGKVRTAKWFIWIGIALLFILSWPPVVDSVGIWLERDYPAVKVESYPPADAIIVLGGGVGMPPPEVEYPYPVMFDSADRVWHGARLWHAQRAQWPERPIKIYCTGPDASLHTPLLLSAFSVPSDSVVAFDGPLNTEEEARRYDEELAGKTVLLVTSALHMKRASMIFKKYAPSLKVIPAATDHQFFDFSARFAQWQCYFPNVETLCRASAIEHEIVGILRYMW